MSTYLGGRGYPFTPNQLSSKVLCDIVQGLIKEIIRAKEHQLASIVEIPTPPLKGLYERIVTPSTHVHTRTIVHVPPIAQEKLAKNKKILRIAQVMKWEERIRNLFILLIIKETSGETLNENRLQHELVKFIESHPPPYQPPDKTED